MRRLALITGASAGIGAAFAHAYARRGLDVAITARRADRLEALASELSARHGVDALVYPADLARPETPAALIAALPRPADVLVNNAGYGMKAAFRATPWAEQAAFIQVMTTAPAELAHRALGAMVQRGYGRIVNVASLAGLAPGAHGPTLYAAAKAFLIRFSESLHLDVADKGVHVTALCPGFTRSEFHDAAGTRAEVAAVPQALWQSAEEVVERGIAANEANAAVCVPGWANKAAAGLARLTPDALARAVMRRGAARLHKPE